MGVAMIRVGFEGRSEDLASPLQLLRVGRVGGMWRTLGSLFTAELGTWASSFVSCQRPSGK